MAAYHPSLQQRTLRVNPAQHTPSQFTPPPQVGNHYPGRRLYADSPRPRAADHVNCGDYCSFVHSVGVSGVGVVFSLRLSASVPFGRRAP
jgi:hypothetical protein